MTRKDKELLLNDICARIPYGVKGINTYNVLSSPGTWETEFNLKFAIIYRIEKFGWRPYLFPMSSMTEEQRKEYEDALTYHDYVEGGWTIAKSFDEYIVPYWFVDFCNKNHFDYRGLIDKGLAIDATNLNIY